MSASGSGRTARRAVVARALGLGLAVATLAAAFAPHLSHSTDDAFITYRYARNLAAGRGLVFNPGERHLGTTAPGWAVILGLGGRLVGEERIPLLSGLLSLGALLLSLVLLSRRLLPEGSGLLAATSLLVAGNRWLIEVLGHEGFAQTCLVLVALELLERGVPWASGLAWGAAVFVRPDAGLMGAVAGLDEWRRRRRLPVALLLAAVASTIVAGLVVWALAGKVVPASLGVKLAEAQAPALAVVPPYLARLGRWFWRCFGWGGPGLVVLSVGGWLFLVRVRRQETLRVLLPAGAILLFYPVLRVNFAPWYLIFPLLALSVGAGAAVVVGLRRGPWLLRVAVLALACAAVASPLRWEAATLTRPPDPRAPEMTAAGQWIEARSAPDDVVATVEVGFLGYACDRPVLDLIGLCSPGVLDAAVSGRLPALVLERRPAYLVYNTAFSYLLGSLLDEPAFRAGYEMVWRRPPSPGHLSEIQIWRRNDRLTARRRRRRGSRSTGSAGSP